MVVITRSTLQYYGETNTNAIDALNDWYVFNVKGNRYRLVAIIHFDVRTLYIRFIGTHAEYDKIKDIQNI